MQIGKGARMGMAVEVAKYSFTVAEYHLMAEVGIFSEDDRVELIAGGVIQMPPIGSRHAACVARVNALLQQAVGNRAVIFPQNPISLSEHSEPQPDLCVLHPREDYYAAGLPGPADVVLIIEVADSSLEYDRLVKLPLYARAGIPEVWIANLREGVVETYRQPENAAYRAADTARLGETVRAHTVPGIVLAVAAILG